MTARSLRVLTPLTVKVQFSQTSCSVRPSQIILVLDYFPPLWLSDYCQWQYVWWAPWWLPERHLHPSSWNLWVLPYVAKYCTETNKLKLLRSGDYPGLSRWAVNIITGLLIGEWERDIKKKKNPQKTDTGEEEKVIWPQKERLESGGFKSRNVNSPRGRGKEQILSRASCGRMVLSTLHF